MKLKQGSTCHGNGEVREQKGFFSELIKCGACEGLGNVINFKPLVPTLFEMIFRR